MRELSFEETSLVSGGQEEPSLPPCPTSLGPAPGQDPNDFSNFPQNCKMPEIDPVDDRTDMA